MSLVSFRNSYYFAKAHPLPVNKYILNETNEMKPITTYPYIVWDITWMSADWWHS